MRIPLIYRFVFRIGVIKNCNSILPISHFGQSQPRCFIVFQLKLLNKITLLTSMHPLPSFQKSDIFVLKSLHQENN